VDVQLGAQAKRARGPNHAKWKLRRAGERKERKNETRLSLLVVLVLVRDSLCIANFADEIQMSAPLIRLFRPLFVNAHVDSEEEKNCILLFKRGD
jgi:hypothetical protein